MTKEMKQQFTYRITNANSTELVVILYDMILCYLDEGEQALQDKAETEWKDAIRKARNCINELMQSLDMKYEPAPTLSKLYLFCVRKLAQAEVHHEKEYFDEIRRVIRPLRDAFDQIAPQNKNGAVMGNSQVVYAGLTYGKHQLAENMADQGSNRGMMA